MASLLSSFMTNMFGSSNEEEEEEERPKPKSTLKRRARRASMAPNLASAFPREDKKGSGATNKHTRVKRRPRSMGDALDTPDKAILKPITNSRRSRRQSTMPKVIEEEEEDKENEKGSYKVDKVNLKELKIVVKREPIKVLQDRVKDGDDKKSKKKALQSDVEDEILKSGGKKTPKRTRKRSSIKKRYLETDTEDDDFEISINKGNKSKKIKSSDSDTDYKPEEDEESFRDAILDANDDDDDGDSFIAAPEDSPNKVFTFYSKSELRRSKVEADVTVATPTKRASSRRVSTNFSPLVKDRKKSELKVSSRRRQSMIVKRETPKRTKKPPTPSASMLDNFSSFQRPV